MGTFLMLIFILSVIYIATRSSGDSNPPRPDRDEPVIQPPGRVNVSRSPHPLQRISPRNEAALSDRAWVSPGESIEVAGFSIPGGMIYIGDALSAVNKSGREPALINPQLKIAKRPQESAVSEIGYWPSYSDISPSSRAVYLQWLSEGRVDPHLSVGYVFLFFYGIERRALFDAIHSASARADLPALTAEVARLIDIYGNNGSFRSYASSFLDYVKGRDVQMDRPTGNPPRDRSNWQLPFDVKLAIGSYVQKGMPIPVEWALAWFRLDPRCGLKTAGTRCPEELERLFAIRYRERFGEGMLLKRNKTNLRVEYRAASASFHGIGFGESIDVPDVTSLVAPLNKIRKLGYDVQLELDRYSRWVGRTGDRESPAAIALLPAAISEARLSGDSAALLSTVKSSIANENTAVIYTADLLRYWPAKDKGKLTKAEAASLGEFLSNFGFGVEPDVRFGGTNPCKTDRLVIFRLVEGAGQPSGGFDSARVLLRLGASIATADDQVSTDEQRHLEEHLETGLRLPESDRVRLRAFFRWLVAEPPSLAGLKSKLRMLSVPQRASTGRFLLAVAGADGHVSAPELKILNKLYDLLGLDSSTLYNDVHNLAITPSDPAPVTVIPADVNMVRGYAIPVQTKRAGADELSVELDLTRVKGVIADTEAVEHLLSGIFVDDVDESAGTAVDDVDETTDLIALPTDTVCGLDAAHSDFVRAVAAKDQWERAELCRLAEQHGLMPAGAIEMINEAAFNACDEPLLEGEVLVELNRFAFEEMTA